MPKAKEPTIAYRDPETGATWSGRGLKPAWLRAAIDNGENLEDFATTDALVPDVPPSEEFTEQLKTINLYTDPALNVVQDIDLDLIDDSAFQPRTHYPEDYIAGLAESMKAVGMLSAMLVRPKADGRFENVFGHCRKRGARMASMVKGPCIVRELTDAESAQLQAVENLQRKDLDAFDEAQSFAAYISTHGCTKDEFCRRTGLSRTHVYNRLKLATLHDEGRKALLEGKIKSEVATLIARVPGDKHQAHALKLLLDLSPRDAGRPADELLTVRKARDLIREKFTLGLKGVLWALDDATLVPSAGACTVCPKRSGVDPILYTDLFGAVSTYSNTPKGENVCTDPACFDIKKTAQLKANQAVLEAKGKTVLAGGKARQTISAQGEVKNGYVPLSQVKEEIKKAVAKGKTAPTIITVQNPRDGKTIEVVKIDDAKAAGLKIAPPKTTSNNAYGSQGWKEAEAKREAQREKAQAQAKADTDFHMALLTKVREAAAAAPRCTLDLQLIAQLAISGVKHTDQAVIATLYGVAHIVHLREQVGSWPADKLALFLLDCAMAHNIVQNGYGQPAVITPLLSAAKQYGIDVGELRKDHAAAEKGKPVVPPAKATFESNEEDFDDEEVDA